MATISVLLSGKVKLQGYGWGRPIPCNGTGPLAAREGSTVREAIRRVGVPDNEVSITTVNGRRCSPDSCLSPGDSIILVPADPSLLGRVAGR